MTGLRLAALAVLIMFFGGSRAGGASGSCAFCADPNNLPFSNEREEGFENRIAELVADELVAELSYTWWAQRRGFIRSTLGAPAPAIWSSVSRRATSWPRPPTPTTAPPTSMRTAPTAARSCIRCAIRGSGI